jgi:2-polyprenyl-3-methyl-5-hydroxy-6-metoxy-1,4-benzoquinol methylase
MRESEDALYCPIDKIALDLIGDQLICSAGHIYPVTRGIPRFTSEGYSSAFGYQWKNFAKTQFDSFTRTSITKNRVTEACGEHVWNKMNASRVLEVGCGAGRFTEVLLSTGSYVFSTDLSLAVDVNKTNFPSSNKHMVLQADVAQLPFKPETFDIVFCLGVIQHTPNPEKTIKQLTEQVAPGGWLVIDHYRKSLSWYLRTAPLARAILKRLPHEKALLISRRMYFFAKPFYQKSRNRFYRKVLNVIFPIVYFDNELPELSKEFKDDWSILDTFDSLTDWHKHRRNVAQIRGTLEKLNFEEIICFEGGNGIVARARKRSKYL